MSTEAMVLRIAGLLGSDKLPQIRVALKVPEPKKEVPAPIDRQAKLEAATTVEECWEVYRNAPSVSELKAEALKKVLSLATTAVECWEVYRNAPSVSELKAEALKKVLSLATTVEEWKSIFQMTGVDSPEAYACIQAMEKLLSAEMLK